MQDYQIAGWVSLGYAMRVAATSFVMGLAWCSLQTDEDRYR
jgi:hypothetical protein